jgi:protein gp37
LPLHSILCNLLNFNLELPQGPQNCGFIRGNAGLSKNSATIRFVSVEPMLEPLRVDLTRIDWVICGGETVKPGQKNDDGSPAMPRCMDPDWARSLRDQCSAAGVPFFMKQMTNKAPIPEDLMVREFPV